MAGSSGAEGAQTLPLHAQHGHPRLALLLGSRRVRRLRLKPQLVDGERRERVPQGNRCPCMRKPVRKVTHRRQEFRVLEARDVDAAKFADDVASTDARAVRRATGYYIRHLVVIDASCGTMMQTITFRIMVVTSYRKKLGAWRLGLGAWGGFGSPRRVAEKQQTSR